MKLYIEDNDTTFELFKGVQKHESIINLSWRYKTAKKLSSLLRIPFEDRTGNEPKVYHSGVLEKTYRTKLLEQGLSRFDKKIPDELSDNLKIEIHPKYYSFIPEPIKTLYAPLMVLLPLAVIVIINFVAINLFPIGNDSEYDQGIFYILVSITFGSLVFINISMIYVIYRCIDLFKIQQILEISDEWLAVRNIHLFTKKTSKKISIDDIIDIGVLNSSKGASIEVFTESKGNFYYGKFSKNQADKFRYLLQQIIAN